MIHRSVMAALVLAIGMTATAYGQTPSSDSANVSRVMSDLVVKKTPGRIPAFPVSKSNPDWATFFKYANSAANGKNQFQYGIVQVANVWAADGMRNDKMRDWCLARFRTVLAGIMAKWNAKQNVTQFSGDSYLYAGDKMSELALVADWWGDHLTAQERADLSLVCEQCLFNIWNHSQAKWNGKSYPWSGWSARNGGNPWNNYFYRAHWKATLHWAIYTQSPKWLAKIKELVPIIKQKYAKLVGGGSLEGTGYGTAYWQLFQDIWVMKQALGIDLTEDCRVAEHIEYFVQATTPDYKSVTPIGDTPPAVIKDTTRAIIIWGCMLCPNSPQAAKGRYWLKKTIRRTRPEFCWQTCYDVSGPEAALAPNSSYFASGVGHLFARSDDGALVSMQAGEYLESHDHRDQGEVQIYLNGAWRFVSANVFSHSGILQSSAVHNCVVFRDAKGKVIEPRYGNPNPPVMKIADAGKILTVSVDLKPAFSNAKDILTYTRKVTWDRNAKRLKIADEFTTNNGVTGNWSGTFRDQPEGQTGGSYVAGPLKITTSVRPLAPVDWKTEAKPRVYDRDCWRLEMRGQDRYSIEIAW